MSFVFSMIGIFISLLIFKATNEKKLFIYILSVLLIPITVSFVSPLNISLNRAFLYTFIISLYFQDKNSWKSITEFPLWKSFLFLLSCLIIVGLFDSRINIFVKIVRPIRVFIENYFLCILTFISLKDNEKIDKIYNLLFVTFLVMTIYGILNYVFSRNPYQDIIANAYSVNNIADEYIFRGDRSRISSFVYHPILYGQYLAMAALFLSFDLLEEKIFFKRKTKLSIIILFVLVIANLLFVSTRTPQFTFAVGFVMFYLFYFIETKRVGQVFVVFILLILALQIPAIEKVYEQMEDIIITGGESVEGSSLEMREKQLFASYLLFVKNPVTGNGLRYIDEDLGWEDRKYGRVNTGDLGGFESFMFELLIEQGIVGIIGHFVLFFALVLYHVKNFFLFKNKKDKFFVALNIGVILSYLVFIFGTGELNSMPFFFLLMGMSIRYIYIHSKELQS